MKALLALALMLALLTIGNTATADPLGLRMMPGPRPSARCYEKCTAGGRTASYCWKYCFRSDRPDRDANLDPTPSTKTTLSSFQRPHGLPAAPGDCFPDAALEDGPQTLPETPDGPPDGARGTPGTVPRDPDGCSP